jgi:hypothetical protein
MPITHTCAEVNGEHAMQNDSTPENPSQEEAYNLL